MVAGVAHLRGRGDIDPGRVGVWGVSEGGYVVALAAASPEVAFVVGVSAPGVSAIASFLWLGAVFVAVFTCAVLAPPARRLRHRGSDACRGAVRRARRWAWLASAMGLLVLLGAAALTIILAGAPATAIGVGLRALATVTTLVVVALVAATAGAWREPWPGRARLGHGAIVATAVATLPLLAYWRLLG